MFRTYGFIAMTVVAVMLSLCPRVAAGRTNVAVFNFQMKSETPDWVWLEKFLADQITTDFARHRGVLAVVARDKMQAMAQQLKWAPEMAVADAKAAGRIKRSLRIKYLVSGVCSVDGDKLEIIGQIVRMDTRKELFRRVISGKTDDVIKLQKRLSAELLSELTGKSSKQLLADLPVWTRSIPAVRALYYGMDLYDHGRYPEAWRHFRSAARKDPGYVEAQYWTGKMYYFMDRYQHARRAFDKFVYLDDFHPRMSDALLEYAHTYEKAEVAPEMLLELYESYGKRWPDIKLHGTYWDRDDSAKIWSIKRSLKLLHSLGHHQQAAQTAVSTANIRGRSGISSLLDNMIRHYQKTGTVLDIYSNVWEEPLYGEMDVGEFVRFAPGQTEKSVESSYWLRGAAVSRRMWRLGQDDTLRRVSSYYRAAHILLAPDGYGFKSVRFYPIVAGQEATISVSAAPLEMYGESRSWTTGPLLAGPITKPLTAACQEGVSIGPLLPLGMLWTNVMFSANDENSLPFKLSKIRIVAEFEKLGATGRVFVDCVDTPYFRVDVDGVFGRSYRGLIGPLKAGKHTLTFHPTKSYMTYDTWTKTVTVEPGKTAKLLGRLPWKKNSPWSFWDRSVSIGRDYKGCNLARSVPKGHTCIIPDGKTIRLVWTYLSDIWTARSSDGRTFSQPEKLALPVSSGWDEKVLACIKDETGRYVLVFQSYRDGQRFRTYTCWSRDFAHWSRPSVVDNGGDIVLYDKKGRFVMLTKRYDGRRRFCDILLSRDAIHWERIGGTPKFDHRNPWPEALIQRDDGRYAIIGKVSMAPSGLSSEGQSRFGSYRKNEDRTTVVYRFLSDDLVKWKPAHIGQFVGSVHGLNVVHVNGRTRILAGRQVRIPGQYTGMAGQVLLSENDKGRWRRSVLLPSAPVIGFSHQPGWGYYLALWNPSSPWIEMDEIGPCLVGAKDIKPWETNTLQLAPVTASLPIVDNTPEPPKPKKPVKPGKPAVPALNSPKIGKLAYVTRAQGGINYRGLNTTVTNKSEALNHKFIYLDSPKGLIPPAKGAGTVWPGALVATFKLGRLTFKAAIDAVDPESRWPTVMRWNLTGGDDFKKAIPLKIKFTSTQTGPGDVLYSAGGFSRGQILNVPLKGGKTMPVRVDTTVRTGDGRNRLWVRFMVCMEGYCRFGDKVHRVRIYDASNNLRCDDVAAPIVESGRTAKIAPGDSVTIDIGDGDFKKITNGFYGHPVYVDGKLWDMRVSQDAGTVSARPLTAPVGSVRINHKSWEAWFVGKKWIVPCVGGSKPVPLPPDSYVVRKYKEFHPSEPDPKAPVLSMELEEEPLGRGKPVNVSVAVGQQTDLAIGTPLTGRLTTTRKGRKIRFNLEYRCAGGMPIRGLYLKGYDKSGWPMVQIRDAQSQSIARITLDKGYMTAGYSGTWEIPQGVSGKLSMEPRHFIPGPEPKLTKTTITVK